MTAPQATTGSGNLTQKISIWLSYLKSTSRVSPFTKQPFQNGSPIDKTFLTIQDEYLLFKFCSRHRNVGNKTVNKCVITALFMSALKNSIFLDFLVPMNRKYGFFFALMHIPMAHVRGNFKTFKISGLRVEIFTRNPNSIPYVLMKAQPPPRLGIFSQ